MTRTEASEALRTGLRGPIVAMTTPFDEDVEVDTEGLRTLTRFYNESDVKGVVAAGSSGEFFSLTAEERKHVIETVVEASDDDTLVLGGCAHTGTMQATDFVEFSEDVGVDGVLVSPPYYAFSGFEGVKRHFERISEETDVGICVYFSSSALQFSEIAGFVEERRACPEEMKELAAIPNVGAIKDASGDYGFHKDVVQELGGEDGEIAVMGSNGMEYHLWGHLAGSRTFLSGLGNIWPGVEVEFFERLEDGDFDGAQRIVNDIERDYLHTTTRRIGARKYWPALKAMQEMRGLPGGPSRLPLIEVDDREREELAAMIDRTGLGTESPSVLE